MPDDLKPLTNEEVEAIVAAEIQDSVNYFNSDVATEQEKSLDYYYARPFGNEIQGRSKVVLADVRETVEWIMAPLMRTFFGGRSIVRYVPRGLEDEEWAAQATDFARYCTRSGAAGFTTLYSWFKDALLEKVGAVLLYYDTKERKELERYTHLTQEEFDALIEEDGVELVAFEETTRLEEEPPEELLPEPGVPIPAAIDPMTGEPVPPPEMTPPEPVEVSEYEVHIRRVKPRNQIRVVGIPQEEFLIAGRARELDDDCPFVGRRWRVTNSDLLGMGLSKDEIDQLPRGKSPDQRSRREDEAFGDEEDVRRPDWAGKEMWLTDCWIRIDEDGDGYAELRHILCAGDTKVKIIEDDETSFIPIATLCPVPVPHKFYGLSLADLVMDLQLIRSTLLRQMMDNIYEQNNSRYAVVEGEVEIEDLLTSSPGGVVRMSAQGMVEPLPTAPLGPSGWHLLEYLDVVKQERSGVSKATQGTGDSLNPTATGGVALAEQANQKIEMIARIFSDTGVTRLYEQFLNVMKEADVQEQVIRLRGEWVTIDPRTWAADLDVEVEVGLGTQQSALRVDNLMLLHDIQKQVIETDGRLVSPENLYNVVERIPEAMGFRTEGMFFTKPDFEEEPPAPPPDAKLLEVQAKQEIEKARIEIERETLQFRDKQLLLESQLKREEMETRIRVAEIQAQATMIQAQMSANSNLESARTKQEGDLAKELLKPAPRNTQ